MLVRCTKVGAKRLTTPFPNGKNTILLRLRDEHGATRKLRNALDRVARSSGLAGDATFDLQLAATEALTNALKEASDDHAVEVAIEGADGVVDIEVTDRRRLRPAFRDDNALEAERGRGIPLMLALVDEVEFASWSGGNRVRLRRNAA
jgi:anti-sigma regulatory factor (Ser/Thr protein kinase)